MGITFSILAIIQGRNKGSIPELGLNGRLRVMRTWILMIQLGLLEFYLPLSALPVFLSVRACLINFTIFINRGLIRFVQR